MKCDEGFFRIVLSYFIYLMLKFIVPEVFCMRIIIDTIFIFDVWLVLARSTIQSNIFKSFYAFMRGPLDVHRIEKLDKPEFEKTLYFLPTI